jgi:sec-independent protein translocase protein TatA
MGSFSIFHWLVVLAIVLLLFGAGRLPSVMGDLAKGLKAFRSGLKDEGDKPAEPAPLGTPALQSNATPQAPATAAESHAAEPRPAAASHSTPPGH